jgi:hypothetical protein
MGIASSISILLFLNGTGLVMPRQRVNLRVTAELGTRSDLVIYSSIQLASRSHPAALLYLHLSQNVSKS